MLKFLLLALLLVWLFYSPALRRHGGRSSPDSRTTAKRPPSSQRDGETMMVACDHCDIHVPEDEALKAVIGDRTCHYCCEAHRRAGPSRART